MNDSRMIILRHAAFCRSESRYNQTKALKFHYKRWNSLSKRYYLKNKYQIF